MAVYYTIDADLIDDELTNFPVGIKINSSTGFMTGMADDDWQYLHATVEDAECYVEIVDWDIINGTALMWVKVPTVSATVDTVIKLEMGENNYSREITSPEVIDDFTGENGDPLNPTIWGNASSDYGSAFTIEIQNNEAHFSLTGVNAYPGYDNSSVTSRFKLSGDFDIQIDFSDVALLSRDGAGISINCRFDNSYMVMLKVQYTSGTGQTFLTRDNSGSNNDVIYSRSNTYGKLRLVRSGSDISFYTIDGGGSWVFRRTATVTDLDCVVKLTMFDFYSGSAIVGDLDNFTINDCEGFIDRYIGQTGEPAAQNVWGSEFAAVYHMANDPTGGAYCILDSTINVNHGTPYGSMTSGDLVNQGFGRAIDFDGSNDYIGCGSGSSLDNIQQKTILLQMNLDSWGADGGYGRPVSKLAGNNSNNTGWSLFVNITNATILLTQAFNNNVNIAQWKAPNNSLALGEDYVFSVTYDRSSAANDPEMMINGESVIPVETTSPVNSAVSDASEGMLIGARPYVGASDREFDGKISELWIMNILEPAAWQKAIFHILTESLLTFSADLPEISTYKDLIFTIENITERLSLGCPCFRLSLVNITEKREIR